MIPHPSALTFLPYVYSTEGWPCANCGGLAGLWYEGEPVPGMCIPNALPVNYGVSLAMGLGLPAWVPKEMLGLVEGGGLCTVAELVREYEEEGEEVEEQGEQPPAAGEVEPS